jgi:hypothetical protein
VKLRDAKVLLLDDRDLRLEIFQRFELGGMEARLIPFAAIERRMLISISADDLQSFEDQFVALCRRHGFPFRKPVAAC